MSDRPTRKLRIPIGPSYREIARALREIEACVRATANGGAADRINDVIEALAPPAFNGIVELQESENPKAWPTPGRILWMAERLAAAAQVSLLLCQALEELVDDAKITGSFRAIEAAQEALDQARTWGDSIGLPKRTL